MARHFPRESNLRLKVVGKAEGRCGERRVGAVGGMRSCACGMVDAMGVVRLLGKQQPDK
jgi:hypothetical protein